MNKLMTLKIAAAMTAAAPLTIVSHNVRCEPAGRARSALAPSSRPGMVGVEVASRGGAASCSMSAIGAVPSLRGLPTASSQVSLGWSWLPGADSAIRGLGLLQHHEEHQRDASCDDADEDQSDPCVGSKHVRPSSHKAFDDQAHGGTEG